MATNKSYVPYSLNGDKDQDEKLLQPIAYFQQAAGGHPREKLTLAMNYWLKIPIEKLQAISDIMKIMHHCSLLIDDIQDNATLRGGIPTAHMIYGLPSTINTAGYALFMTIERVLALNHPKAIQVYVEELLELWRGQGIDIYWRDNYICPSEAEYRLMAIQKLGALFKLDACLKQVFSDCKKDFSTLSELLGVYFQIRDDYCSLCMQEYHDKKSYCEDFTEGKFSFPIIYAIQSKPEGKEIMNILSQRTKDPKVKKNGITLLEKCGAFAYTRTTLEELNRKIRDEVEKLGGNPLLIEVLDDSLDWQELKCCGQ
ncbi:geranylgeranyl pyrophosphate synthase [Diachasma alloeum]|uniref:geranylgeranyl pyrophosphate synthase n=1 Tax=Diachasma alloeum TaxID=454923 RepID=UPI0007382183|nr:geranylgeranyl pyrophosphate synthase [Diachasma alloeum]